MMHISIFHSSSFVYLPILKKKKKFTKHKPCADLILQELYSGDYLKAMLLIGVCVP